jgi:RNA polymerase sigma-70 factor (sigma-E family)
MAVFAAPNPEDRVVPLRLVSSSAPPTDVRAELVDLYRHEYDRTARLAYLLCGDAHTADDLAHDAFVALYEHWHQVDAADRRIAYLRATVVNLSNSRHRRRATARRHAAPVMATVGATNEASAEETALPRLDRGDVLAALATLPDRQRTAVVLRHWMRMTEGEIADTMDCSIGSVRTHLSRGHAALATRLGGLR